MDRLIVINKVTGGGSKLPHDAGSQPSPSLFPVGNFAKITLIHYFRVPVLNTTNGSNIRRKKSNEVREIRFRSTGVYWGIYTENRT